MGTTADWEVVRPGRPSRVAGVRMAGFRSRGPVDVRAVGHPAVTLVLEFGDGPLVVDENLEQQGNLVARPAFGGLRVRGEQVECVQVRLSPVAAHAVLGTWQDHTVVALDDLWGREAARIRERFGEASSWQERFAMADAVLARRYEDGPRVDPEVARAWDRINAGRGRVRVDDLAAEVGWSRKRLWSRFQAQLGMPPKRAARLVRFDHAARGLAAGREAARVAAESGYADQSHLHRDVRAFSGLTPAAMTGQVWLAVDRLAWGNIRPIPADAARTTLAG
ncbi:AraC family transcriptional regulator [Amycolatopsis sp. 195334CR]|uniref:helix-turn-helix domain-containing protein n=1 Tax=Amycolatopsis sp. 195334CR TaxID=2814588 RepID=UPI001A9067FC|nr:AraC family transcriptional regulator [Amycolatopsis sp. 195334CR]MBN6041123.1 helix-turn-helix transcriptional regulator [Amycolatopsis sp. 195334CR]